MRLAAYAALAVAAYFALIVLIVWAIGRQWRRADFACAWHEPGKQAASHGICDRCLKAELAKVRAAS